MDAPCGALIRELEQIWREIGEKEEDQDRMLMELKMECMKVYRTKLNKSINERTYLHQSLAASEAELATLMTCLGECSVPVKLEKNLFSLRDQIVYIKPQLEKLRINKDKRLRQFIEIKSHIQKIITEISGTNQQNDELEKFKKDDHDLSLPRLEEYQAQLTYLEKEKSERLNKVLQYVHEIHRLCSVLGFEFSKIVGAVHSGLCESNLENFMDISDKTLGGLSLSVQNLRQEKHTRLQKLRGMMEDLFKLWSLMEISTKEKDQFARVATIRGSLEEDIVSPGLLSLQTLKEAEEEVNRLKKTKASRIKEIVSKKWTELEELCQSAYIERDMSTSLDKAIALVDSGLVDSSEVLENMESQIEKAKEEAESRKEIMERVAKWVTAFDEENWLEEYNQDQSRYSAVRGAHLNLKRAEKARILIAKIPSMVDNLLNKTLSWENKRNKPFLYDGVRLVTVLDKYKLARLQKEEEKRWYRDHKKLQNGMFSTERELLYSPKQSPRRSTIVRKTSLGFMTPPPVLRRATPEKLTPRSYTGRLKMCFSRQGIHNLLGKQLSFSIGSNNVDI